MIDLTGIKAADPVIGTQVDLNFANTQTTRAKNILSIQIETLEYAPQFGIDIKYFLDSEVKFQTAGFLSYCIQMLASYGINVASVDQLRESLNAYWGFNLKQEQNTTGLLNK